jgi:hypothetical protein
MKIIRYGSEKKNAIPKLKIHFINAPSSYFDAKKNPGNLFSL